MESLAERLGADADDRLLIISADLMGTSHAANAACFDAVRTGIATTATIAVPGPWARHAAMEYRGADIGVHLTLNAQLEALRWGPITHAPSLLDGEGGFPRTVEDLWDHADLDEVRRELRSQLERAVLWGFNITHLTSHLNALQGRPEFFDIYLDLAVEYHLPLRLEGAAHQDTAGFPFRQLAAEEGVLAPDHFTFARGLTTERLAEIVAELSPGVTELFVEPAADTEELRAADPDADVRVEAAAALRPDGKLADAIAAAGVTLIDYRPLRALQRTA